LNIFDFLPLLGVNPSNDFLESSACQFFGVMMLSDFHSSRITSSIGQADSFIYRLHDNHHNVVVILSAPLRLFHCDMILLWGLLLNSVCCNL